MTDQFWLRVAIVVAVACAVVGVAVFTRRARAWRRHEVVVAGLGPGVYLFSSVTCATCDETRRRLAGVDGVIEIAYETAGPDFPAVVDRVPAVARLDEGGSGWIAYGLPSATRLGRWLGG